MTQVIQLALLPVLFVLFLGYTAGRFRIVSNTHVGELNALLMNYALPAALFVATGSSARQEMLAQWPFAVVMAGGMMAVYGLWYLLGHLGFKQPSSDTALMALTISLPNAAALGIPVASALLGPGHAVPVALAIAVGTLLPSSFALASLELAAAGNNGAARRGIEITRAVSRAFRRPVMLAPMLGIVLSLAGLPLPPLATALLMPIGASAGGLALFITGLILSAQHFRLGKDSLLGTLMANVLRPAAALCIASVLPMPAPTAKLAVLFSTFPSGFYGILFGTSYGVKTEEVGSTVIASTVSAMLTVAGAMIWLYD